MARLVNTHSTYVTGLIKVLTKLTESDKLVSIIPGHLYYTNSSIRTGLQLRLTTSSTKVIQSPKQPVKRKAGMQVPPQIETVSQKVIARNLSHAQEVFLVYHSTAFTPESDLATHLRELLKKEKCTIMDMQAERASKEKVLDEPAAVGGTSIAEKDLRTKFGWEA